ncbi:interferon-induced protein with tetratricopeptide repeats 1-like [Hypanus sabinus]|uniref:interferon-induced protein with tetratricopeptide repeats 1-like n=1 Tax=Hypanus sabinus TaxID=79690 RepID=UPI0028C3C78E|nr:interferon-induced protein with tetratricopeptide repeats 1-like [Hypanus sabinus]
MKPEALAGSENITDTKFSVFLPQNSGKGKSRETQIVKRQSAMTDSNTQRDLLKEKLDQLQYHFTWGPQKGTIDLEDEINTPGDLLKEKLDQLQCHFTWRPQKETIDLDDLIYRLQDSNHMNLKYKEQFCNQLAFVNCLNTPGDLLKEKLDQLQCHFTWRPQKETIDVEDVIFRLHDSIDMNLKYKAQSYNQLAFLNCLQGNCEEAIQNLKEGEKILRENHKDEFERRSIITYGNFAWVHYHMGQLTEAQSYLDKLEMICKPLSDGPRYTAMIPEVYGEKGWSLLNSAAEYYEEAKECFAKALEQDPDNTEWIMGYATALSRLESISGTPESRDQSRSVKYFRRVLELDPDDAVAMVLLALKLQRLRQNEKANELVEQALQKTPDLSYVLRYAAKFYRKKGSVEKAIELLKQALGLTPHSCFLHHQLGLCYRSKLNYTRCKYPRNPVFHQKAELINLCKYHFEKAFDHRRRSFIKAQLDFADICITSGEYSRAEETYRRLVELVDIRPENMQSICLEAGLFELHQKRSETNAVCLFLKGVKIDYNSIERQTCRTNLEEWVERKLLVNAHDSKALGVKAFLYQLDGIKGRAIKYFEKALKFDPGNEEYVSALFQLRI